MKSTSPAVFGPAQDCRRGMVLVVQGACLEVSLDRQKNAPLKAEARLSTWKGPLEEEGHAARVHGPTTPRLAFL